MWVAFLPCLLFQHHSLHGYVDSQKAQAPFRFIISVFWMRSLWRERAKRHEPHKWSNHTHARNSPTCHTVLRSMPTPTTGYRHLILYCGLSWVAVGDFDPLADGSRTDSTCIGHMYLYLPLWPRPVANSKPKEQGSWVVNRGADALEKMGLNTFIGYLHRAL